MPPVPSAPLKLKSSRPNVSPARLAVELGTAVGVGLPVSATAEAAMKRARDDDGLGESDFSAVYEAQKKVKP